MNDTLYGPLPPGDYKTKIVVVSNTHLATLEVTEGRFKGQRFFAHTELLNGLPLAVVVDRRGAGTESTVDAVHIKEKAKMKLSELKPGDSIHAPLDTHVLAVLSRREDGWCVYVGSVRGEKHSEEWQKVALEGSKQTEPVAIAIVENLFRFKIDLPYCL